ncbi:Zuotin [Basidiobolus ranarum]|uniref:Zuotin n=1 Tax=Basidiobolus ranarum TaxID=34480 RepID=A0ABR2WCQ3_9FUNG
MLVTIPTFLLPTPPSSWTAGTGSKVHASVSAPSKRTLEPVGRHFVGFARRKFHERTYSEDERIESAKNAGNDDDEEDLSEDEEESRDLLESDPKDWKEQDHYEVLGLSKYRYKADEKRIIKAHRKKVLKHHPDKKAASGNINDDAFFKCIQKAFEILMDPIKRRQFDSVDPGLPDIELPSKSKDFFESFGRIFELESRFSNKQPVPVLGDMNSVREDVEAFYDFWYNFDSWRTFEYLDKESSETADNRDDKRYYEKKNKAERARRKKEDNARLRELVDAALKRDPRIAIFKEEEIGRAPN